MIASEDFERIVAEVCRRLRHELVPTKRGVWMSVRDVMRELHYDTVEAARKWIKRRGVTVVYRGTALLVARKDVEEALIKSARRRNKRDAASVSAFS
jgi:hypothetical protein